ARRRLAFGRKGCGVGGALAVRAAGVVPAPGATPDWAAWAASSSGGPPPAARATTRNLSGLRRTMSSAWVPIEPVEPRITISRGWDFTGPLSFTRRHGHAAALT